MRCFCELRPFAMGNGWKFRFQWFSISSYAWGSPRMSSFIREKKAAKEERTNNIVKLIKPFKVLKECKRIRPVKCCKSGS